jgi:intracellular septation protein A
MSDQAKLFLLQRRLEEIRRSKRNFTITVIVLTILSGVILNIYGVDLFTGLILCTVGTLTVWFIQNYYGKQEAGILWHIQQMAITIPKCPNCGKEIPQGNFEFCPFCGKSLKP